MKNYLLLLLSLFVVIACKQEPKKNTEEIPAEPTYAVVDIVSNAMDIVMVDTISSGWQTFKYHNKSNDTHLILFDKYPEGKTIQNTIDEVGPPFQNGMNLIIEGKPEEGFAAFNELPAWFFSVVFSGGVGLISPKSAAEITIKLDPGYYVVECYVKMENGIFHTSMGMATPLIVSTEVSDHKPLEADVLIDISGDEGIVVDGTIGGGEQVFAVNFKDQKVHEHFLGHDVNLVRVEEGADVSVLESWIDWSQPKGLVSPAPEGFTFLGGMNDLPEGSTGYFKADLEPGNYVLISEVPNASKKNMLKSFTIAE